MVCWQDLQSRNSYVWEKSKLQGTVITSYSIHYTKLYDNTGENTITDSDDIEFEIIEPKDEETDIELEIIETVDEDEEINKTVTEKTDKEKPGSKSKEKKDDKDKKSPEGGIQMSLGF